MTELIESKCTKLLVAAIEIGTTHTKYAFSSKHNWGNVWTNCWPGSFLSHKTPTCLLLKRDQLESWFGYEAVEKYSELKENDLSYDYYFFERFAMILHEDISFHRHIVCKDIHNEPLEAGFVFKHCIIYLKKHISEQLKRQSVSDDDIEFILTVPAISGEKAKMFIREAALNAGIKKENLSIVLETEAASIYCQYLKFAEKDSTSPTLDVLKPGTKYILADIGGERVDISVHQKCEDNTLEEILPASRGPWGGKSVDEQFISFLKDLFGEEVLKKLKKEDMEDYLDIMREFETKKQLIRPESSGKTIMYIPPSLLSLGIRSCGVKSFKEVIQKNDKHKNNVEFRAGKLAWDNNFFRGFLKKSIDGIVKHFDDIFQEPKAREINIIMMVGGFSNCLLVQDAIRRNFTKATVIVPQQAEFAVIKGAVYFGHIPDAVSRRSASYTYGIQTWPEFKDGIHHKEKRVEVGQSILCKDVFLKIVTKGEKVMPGCIKSQIIEILKESEYETDSEIRVFISDSKDPKFIDEQDCMLVGLLHVQLPGGPMCKIKIQVSVIFGKTDLKFQARHAFSENPKRLWSTYDQYREKNKCYKMESNTRGVLLIIKNSKCETYCGERLGTDHDCKKLKDLFSVLGFKVLVKENLRASEMLSELQIFAKTQLLAQVDCMVLAVLSHGTTDNVMCGSDGKGIDVMKSIVPIFSAIECPNLRGKPKMFICNACRGEITDESVEIVLSKTNINVNRRIQPEELHKDDPYNSTFGTSHNVENQDIVLCFSTFPEYESYTYPEEGSWFIQEFVKVFEEQSHDTHVLDMLTEEMLSELQIFAKNQLLAQVDCMVLAVLSHGTTDVICGTDGVGIHVMKSIVPIFSAIECPNLRGKPKMIICNACRGEISIADDLTDTTSKSTDIEINVNRRIHLEDPDNSTLGTKHNIEYQDIVMCYSTFPGYESYTNLEEGSWFIQEFVKVFEEQSHHTHVLDMLTKINKKVSQKEYKEHAAGSTCVQTSTLTDSWYLVNPSIFCRFEPLSAEFSNVTEL